MADKEPKAIDVTDARELEKMLANRYPPASVTFFNDLPPRWQVDIIEIACKFMYDDGRNDDKGKKQLRIKGGGGQETLTATHDGCCRAYIALTKAKAFDGTNEEWVIPNTATVEDNYCGGNLKIHLVAETNFSKGAPAGSHMPRFKLVIER